tara:strand:- start:24 stop:1640 length:1617 start_codon:yes stop_codon:yes gene_type:complete
METTGLKAAIYARFSTDMQADRSIDDQISLCTDFALKQGLTIAETYSDAAQSGGSIFGRDGLLRMMEDARQNKFQVIVIEALDRLSRDMEDLAGLHKRLSFQGIEIRAVHEGKVDTILVGLRGLVGQLYREDNVHKVRRGMAGRVKDGLHAGGRAYGYQAIDGKKGELEIIPAEADTVRRIFTAYAAGTTPRAIAKELNAEGIAPPRGARQWNASTIAGNAKRGTGILNNRIYIGEIVWNRVRMVRDPDTGKRVSRPNPPEQWQRQAAPHLAIIDQTLFDQAHGQKASRAHGDHAKYARRKHLLSGLLRCGACGGGMQSYGKGARGTPRIRCSSAKEGGFCPDSKSFSRTAVERLVIEALRQELAHPDVITAYVQTYHAERKKLAATANQRRDALNRKIARLDAECERTLDFMIKGIGHEERLKQRIAEAEQELAEARRELAALDTPPPVIELHPATMTRYRETLDALATAIGNDIEDDPEAVVETRRAMDELVESVTVQRSNAGETTIQIAGRLTPLLGPNAFPEGVGGINGSGGGT